ncbi:hypothetical protein BIFBIF_01706 [Bifidobacterium bifidum ATCC 29521 = JCM 1255 = DSM 20456]|nr:hypothetical protein BIFBIF_01706 [Bifidobacterium bifidum ATCC 29521 = JCM 1255 = DSM 20456]
MPVFRIVAHTGAERPCQAVSGVHRSGLGSGARTAAYAQTLRPHVRQQGL